MQYDKNHPANVNICFSNSVGLIWRGVRWILQNVCASQKPSSKCTNMFFDFFWSHQEVGAMDSTKCLCRGVSRQNAVRIKKTSSKCRNMFPDLLGLIWRGARWVLQNACAGVCYYKMQCVSHKLSSKCKKCENMFSNLLGDIWKGTQSILQNICAGVYYYKMQCASQKPSSTCTNMFFELFGSV